MTQITNNQKKLIQDKLKILRKYVLTKNPTIKHIDLALESVYMLSLMLDVDISDTPKGE